MPKEKATRKAKAKVADAGGKKKKGTFVAWLSIRFIADQGDVQIPTRPSVVSQPTCFSPMSSVTM